MLKKQQKKTTSVPEPGRYPEETELQTFSFRSPSFSQVYGGASIISRVPSFSAYTEAYNVCFVAAATAAAAAPQAVSLGDAGGEMTAEEDQGRTSEEEEGGADSAYQRQVIIYLSRHCKDDRVENFKLTIISIKLTFPDIVKVCD